MPFPWSLVERKSELSKRTTLSAGDAGKLSQTSKRTLPSCQSAFHCCDIKPKMSVSKEEKYFGLMVSEGSAHDHLTHYFKPGMRTNIMAEQSGLPCSGREEKRCKG